MAHRPPGARLRRRLGRGRVDVELAWRAVLAALGCGPLAERGRGAEREVPAPRARTIMPLLRSANPESTAQRHIGTLPCWPCSSPLVSCENARPRPVAPHSLSCSAPMSRGRQLPLQFEAARAGKVSGGRASGESGRGWVGGRGEQLLGCDERERRRSDVHGGSHALWGEEARTPPKGRLPIESGPQSTFFGFFRTSSENAEKRSILRNDRNLVSWEEPACPRFSEFRRSGDGLASLLKQSFGGALGLPLLCLFQRPCEERRERCSSKKNLAEKR